MSDLERRPLIGSRAEHGSGSSTNEHNSSRRYDEEDGGVYHNFAQVTPALSRLRDFVPLSLVVSIGAILVATFAVTPSLAQVNKDYLTILTPNTTLFGVYWLVLFVLEIGFSIVVVFSRKPETRATIVNGVGMRWPLSKALLAFWVLFWTLEMFFVSEIILCVIFLLLLTIWGTLMRHPPSLSRPLDWIFIHVPVRLFLLSILNVAFWNNGLLATHWYKYVGKPENDDFNNSPNHHEGKWEPEHTQHAWIVFGALSAVGFVDALIVFAGRDLAWALGSIYLFLTILLEKPKPPQTIIPLIVISAFQAVAYVASVSWYAWSRSKKTNNYTEIPNNNDEVEQDTPGEGHSDGYVVRH